MIYIYIYIYTYICIYRYAVDLSRIIISCCIVFTVCLLAPMTGNECHNGTPTMGSCGIITNGSNQAGVFCNVSKAIVACPRVRFAPISVGERSQWCFCGLSFQRKSTTSICHFHLQHWGSVFISQRGQHCRESRLVHTCLALACISFEISRLSRTRCVLEQLQRRWLQSWNPMPDREGIANSIEQCRVACNAS